MADVMTSMDALEAREIHQGLPSTVLIEASIQRGEGCLAANGALVVTTGKYTGRSPDDRYVVDTDDVHHDIDWGAVNRPIPAETFDALADVFREYLKGRSVYVTDGQAGADPHYGLKVRVITEKSSQALFARLMFRSLEKPLMANDKPELTVIACPNLKLDPARFGIRSETAIVLNLQRRVVLVAGTSYSGEIKKSVFAVLNYLLPREGVLPMHCAANVGPKSVKDVALFFGLSGTGKTTLSADPSRELVGDDEHGWGPEGVFNFEGGYYAKCIRLKEKDEPEIWKALRFGAMLENVVLDPKTRVPDYDSEALTENTRASYPLSHIGRSVVSGLALHPRVIFFLTADAFGVLPPLSRLTTGQAQYHFISGYTSKLAGTERGLEGVKAVYSTCFGAPFMPRPSTVYAELLAEKLKKHRATVYLINTGWTGGGYGVGERVSIRHTRAMIHAALEGKLKSVRWVKHPIFGIEYPTRCPGVPTGLLDPQAGWTDKEAYTVQARKLAEDFINNFKKYPGTEPLAKHGPRLK